MFTSPPVDAEFRIREQYISLVIDFFGKHVSFHEREDNTISCRLKVSSMAMKHWALQYLDHIEVVYPASLRQQIKESLEKGLNKYKSRIL